MFAGRITRVPANILKVRKMDMTETQNSYRFLDEIRVRIRGQWRMYVSAAEDRETRIWKVLGMAARGIALIRRRA